jgi:hypothetical protein
MRLTGDRGWEYAYGQALERQLASYRDELEGCGDNSHQYLRGVIYGIRVAIAELREARSKHRKDGDADY